MQWSQYFCEFTSWSSTKFGEHWRKISSCFQQGEVKWNHLKNTCFLLTRYRLSGETNHSLSYSGVFSEPNWPREKGYTQLQPDLASHLVGEIITNSSSPVHTVQPKNRREKWLWSSQCSGVLLMKDWDLIIDYRTLPFPLYSPLHW